MDDYPTYEPSQGYDSYNAKKSDDRYAYPTAIPLATVILHGRMVADPLHVGRVVFGLKPAAGTSVLGVRYMHLPSGF